MTLQKIICIRVITAKIIGKVTRKDMERRKDVIYGFPIKTIANIEW
jgi:hypothetical protein